MIEDDHDHGNNTSSVDSIMYWYCTDHDEESFCGSVAQLVQNVILRLNLTTEECLEHSHNDTNTRPTSAEGESIFVDLLQLLFSLPPSITPSLSHSPSLSLSL